MNHTRPPLNYCRITFRLAVATAVAFGCIGRFAVPAHAELTADDGAGVLRLDPYRDTLVPIPTDELRVGYVYNHFSERLQRRVWSFYQGGGHFWYGLGQGTRQPARRLHFAAQERSAESVADLPSVARQYDDHQGDIFVRLRADNRWEFSGRVGVPAIYNVETGRRWEKHADVYMPVSHGGGYHWTLKSGKYVPNRRIRSGARCSDALGGR